PSMAHLAFRLEHFGTRADLHPFCETFHQIRIAGLANADNATIPYADVGLHNPPPVDDDRVRDHEVERTLRACRGRRLPHAVADDLAAAELRLFTRYRQVTHNLDQQIRIGQANTITRRRAVQIVILSTWNLHMKPSPRG